MEEILLFIFLVIYCISMISYMNAHTVSSPYTRRKPEERQDEIITKKLCNRMTCISNQHEFNCIMREANEERLDWHLWVQIRSSLPYEEKINKLERENRINGGKDIKIQQKIEKYEKKQPKIDIWEIEYWGNQNYKNLMEAD